MLYFALSADAASAAFRAGIESCPTILPDHDTVLDVLGSASVPSCVIADVGLIDDGLTKALSTAQRTSGQPVGIVPFSVPYLNKLKQLLTPSDGSCPDDASYIAYSVEKNAITLASERCSNIPGRLKLYTSNRAPEVFAELTAQHTCFAAQLNGRQTFCFLNDQMSLHPDTFGTLHGIPGIITPTMCNISHFFIQSCHSPFRWPDFGDEYLSVPLAFLLRGIAVSFIASTRVQSIVPDLIALYLCCASNGMTVGEITLELNIRCRSLKIDDDPFVLLGHPDAKVVQHTTERTKANRAITTSTVDTFRGHLYSLAKLLHNLEYSKSRILGLSPSPLYADREFRSLIGNCGQHIRAIVKKGASASHSEKTFLGLTGSLVSRLECSLNKYGKTEQMLYQQLDTISRVFNSQAPRFRALGAIDASLCTQEDLEAFADRLLRAGQKKTLTTISKLLARLWKKKPGYYYHFNDSMEKLFCPESFSTTARRCSSCNSELLTKSQYNISLDASDDYRRREQVVCSRCLVVRDMSPVYASSINASFYKEKGRLRIEIAYNNRSARPEWLFGYFHLNDPNNLSANLNPSAIDQLLSKVHPRSGEWDCTTIRPGQTWTTSISIENLPANLFYLLVECHLFINGCWNWFSFTYRERALDDWLKSTQYLLTVPQRSL